ncbi:MAG TPA: histidine phosphatase family protein [Acidimicrobiales bacterium]|jgi:probable phosphoglycerate mutase|nr:histidine phosphatase family protein [Acidimicrobiales bacterium]
MASSIVIVRHGATEWSEAGRHTGRTDLPLLDKGRDAARRLRPWFADRHFDLVLVSPLRRATETAELAGLTDPAQAAELDADLMEWDYGEVEGITSADYRATHPGWQVWDGCPGGETADDVGSRADRVLARCAAVDGSVALVAHGHVLRILTARWLAMAPVEGRCWVLDPTSPSTLGHEHDNRVVRSWNLTVG